MKITDEQKQIRRRADKAFADKDASWYSRLDDVWTYIMPTRNIERNHSKQSETLFAQVYDSTALNAATSLANQLLTGLTPPWSPWFILTPGPDVPAEMAEDVKAGLFEINRRLYMHLSLSNFVQEMQSSFMDFIIGTGCIAVEANPNGVGVRYKNVPLSEFAIIASGDGSITRFYRQYEWTQAECLAKYEKELSKEMREKFKKEPTDRVKLLDALEPASDLSTQVRKITMLSEHQDTVLSDDVLPYNPYTAFRWGTVPGFDLGVGPAIHAYPDTRTLNTVTELAIKNGMLAIAGVYTGRNDGILNPAAVKLEPGLILPVMDNDNANPPLRKLEVGSDFNITQFQTQMLSQRILKAFYADRFGPIDGPSMTATEVIHRAKVIAQELGATHGRWEAEGARPILQKTLRILAQQDPTFDIQIDGREVDVVFVSNIAQAQRLQELDNLVQWTQMAAQFGQVSPEAGALPKYDDILRRAADYYKVDPRLVRNQQEVGDVMQNASRGLAAMSQPGAAGGQQPGLPQPA